METPKNVKTEYVGDSKTSAPDTGYNWYDKEDATAYQDIFSVVDKIEQEQSYRSSMNVRHARLYSNLELLGLSVYATGSVSAAGSQNLSPTSATYNLVKSCVDTVSSKIAKNRPKPLFLTSGGDWKMKDKSKKLTKYVEGVFYASDYYNVAAKVFIDGCVFGTGVMKFYTQDGSIKCERVIPEEIKVDDNDAIYGKPKSIYQVKQVSREVLVEQYPNDTHSIRSASSSTPDNSAADLIRVVEAWHLSSGKEGKQGKHTIAIENTTLFSEDYEQDHFPFVFFKWSERLTGFFGQGLAEELTGTQVEINRILKNIQLAIKLVAIPRIAIESNSKVSTSQLTSDVGSIFKYQGGSRPPIFHTPVGMNAEVYNHLKWLIQSGYEKTGVSQLSATSKKPSGLDSGAALREYSDIETERFMLTAQKFEGLSLDAAKIIIALSKGVFKENKSLKVNVPGKDFIDTISWKDVDLEEDQYIMKIYPVGLLPTQPAGRLQKVQELIQAGWVDKDKALDLLDFPDLETFQSLETANLNLIEKDVSTMLDTGKYIPPEPQMDLVSAASTAHKYYLKGRGEDLPSEKLELLLRYIDDAERLEKQKRPQELAPPPIITQPALGVPEPLPQSDLLPNVIPLPVV